MGSKGNYPLFWTYTFTTLAIVLWGFSFVWTNDILQRGVAPFTFLFVRLFLAGIILYTGSRLAGKLQKLEKKDYKWVALMAFFEPFIYFLGETYGMKATNSAVLSAVIIATIPVFTLMAERVLYKVPLTVFKIFGTAITIPGIIMVIMKDGETASAEHFYGIVLLFMAVAGSIGYSSVVKKLSGRYNSITITTYQFVIGSMFFLPLFLAFGLDGLNSTFFSKEVMVPLLALTLLCSCLSFACWVASIKRLGMTKTSIFSALIPAVSAVGAAMLGQEEVTLITVAGIAVVISGVIIAQRN